MVEIPDEHAGTVRRARHAKRFQGSPVHVWLSGLLGLALCFLLGAMFPETAPQLLPGILVFAAGMTYALWQLYRANALIRHLTSPPEGS